jgi:hypothetical protein
MVATLLAGLALAATVFAARPDAVLAKDDEHAGNYGATADTSADPAATIEQLRLANPATTSNPNLAAAADGELLRFQAYVNQNWSILGYSSPEAMAGALGDSETNWLARTESTAAGQ